MATNALPSSIEILPDIALAPYTTFKLGGAARYFVRVGTVAQLREALERAKRHRWSVLVLASGSNLIVSDDGFDGLVIHPKLESWGLKKNRLTAGTSASMERLVDESIKAGLAGLEWAGGLPGSFGGAIRGNAGCFGGEIKDSVFSVTSINIETGQEKLRDKLSCAFGYRDSTFKDNSEIIIEATLQLSPSNPKELREKADSHIEYRRERHPLEYPNAGSIFKNVPLELVPKEHLPLFSDSIKDDPFPIVPTAKIIAVAGLKGLRIGEAQVSEKHSNYMVNLGQATAAELVALIAKVKAEIMARYQIALEVEPELVGFQK